MPPQSTNGVASGEWSMLLLITQKPAPSATTSPPVAARVEVRNPTPTSSETIPTNAGFAFELGPFTSDAAPLLSCLPAPSAPLFALVESGLVPFEGVPFGLPEACSRPGKL